jgi:hypothetical protein
MRRDERDDRSDGEKKRSTALNDLGIPAASVATLNGKEPDGDDEASEQGVADADRVAEDGYRDPRKEAA